MKRWRAFPSTRRNGPTLTRVTQASRCIQLFAFLTENLLYRSNQIPERNRRKFLTLLGIPLQPAASARGLVTSPTNAARCKP